MAEPKRMAAGWLFKPDGSLGFTYEPYGRFGPCYAIPDAATYAKVRKWTDALFVLLPTALNLHAFLSGVLKHIFFGPGGFAFCLLVMGVMYHLIVREVAKLVVRTRPRPPFAVALQEFAQETKPTTLWTLQLSCLGLAAVSLWLSHLSHFYLAEVLVLYFYFAVLLGCAAMLTWMIATQGIKTAVRR